MSVEAGRGVAGPVETRLLLSKLTDDFPVSPDVRTAVHILQSQIFMLAREIDRLREETTSLENWTKERMNEVSGAILDLLPATDAGEPETVSGTTHTCGSTGDVRRRGKSRLVYDKTERRIVVQPDDVTEAMIEAGKVAWDEQVDQRCASREKMVKSIFRAMSAAR